jgi:protein transport protein SEC61 subunit gamma and related proteins
MEVVKRNVYYPLKEFTNESIRFFNKCDKPTPKKFKKIAKATAVGFAIMGLIGFFVKLVHIPINGILVGGPLNA